ncbi:DNA polymerase [Kordiimonas sediminis]|uniref:Type-4 uracil-DNA glycosylase n=1 Tax=Kordiimonas sediminis TaxID=1735581 RepID=A0A919ASN7_9PROT|nr:uracil-DNA glycosylase [Kordiimonas sediminis]GHF23564.1 DNA polymerase [Kordiimonas sediminis]
MSQFSDHQTLDPATLLAWQVAMGADEAIDDMPVDRFAPAAQPQSAAGEPAFQPPNAVSQPPARERATQPRPVVAKPVQKMEGAGADVATQVAAAANTLEELQAAMEAFDGGLLKRSAKSTVFSDGVPGSDVMLIGEAPGAEEDQAGKPFIGPAGQFLDRMLASIGLDRAKNVYISNLVPWRPLGNRTPDPAIVSMCLPFIRRHIALAKPKVVVLVGGVSSQALLDTTNGIVSLRGKWRTIDIEGHNFDVLPTYHPAFLLRQPLKKRESWKDLLSVKEKLGLL